MQPWYRRRCRGGDRLRIAAREFRGRQNPREIRDHLVHRPGALMSSEAPRPDWLRQQSIAPRAPSRTIFAVGSSRIRYRSQRRNRGTRITLVRGSFGAVVDSRRIPRAASKFRLTKKASSRCCKIYRGRIKLTLARLPPMFKLAEGNLRPCALPRFLSSISFPCCPH